MPNGEHLILHSLWDPFLAVTIHVFSKCSIASQSILVLTVLNAPVQALEGGGAQETTAIPNASFDCRLSGWSEQSSYKGSTVWSPCDGSTAFKNLRDGDYTFWARIASRADAPEAAMSASNFTVDTSAPVLEVKALIYCSLKKISHR